LDKKNKILVTGGAGFIGSNFIIDQIKNYKNNICNIDKLTYASSLDSLKKIKNNSNYRFIKGDIADSVLISKILNEYNPDYIINFAAESHVDKSIDKPQDFIYSNIVGVANLLINIKQYFQKNRKNISKNFRFLHVSTDEVYGSLKLNQSPFTENSIYNPSSPYSASKAASDLLVKAWNKTYELPVIISHCSNNFGPYQFPEKLIPLVIINCLSERKIPVYGTGKNIRDWIYVEDHCDALNNILINGSIGETYNIGGNTEKSNLDVIYHICYILDVLKPRNSGKKYEELISYVKDRPGHDFRYAISNDKISSLLNWNPKIDFDKGIQKTILWYINNEEWWKNN